MHQPCERIGSLTTILLSLPSTSWRLRKINFIINTLLLLAAADFILFPYFDTASSITFTRVGAVYPDSAKIVVRYPPVNATEHIVKIVWREAKNTTSKPIGPWKDGPTLILTRQNDWVGTGLLRGLWPSTPYECKHPQVNGAWIACAFLIYSDKLSSGNKTDLQYPPMPVQFRTFPDSRLSSGNHFRFIVSSCITPNFPYIPFNSRRIKGFDLLARYLFPTPSTHALKPNESGKNFSQVASGACFRPQCLLSSLTSVFSSKPHHGLSPSAAFLLFLGDFIYADVPTYIGDDKEAYRRLYRRSYQSSFRKVFERLRQFQHLRVPDGLTNIAV
jgi:alkaline phosphatase D